MSNITMEVLETVKSHKELDNAMDNFLVSPSFTTKQKAIELLLRYASSAYATPTQLGGANDVVSR